MNGVGSAMAWQKRGGPAQSKAKQSKAKTCRRSDVFRAEGMARNELPHPGTGEDAQLSITKVRSDFFARNVRLRA